MGMRGRGPAVRELLANRPLVTCVGGIAAIAGLGAGYLAYGLAYGRHSDINDGGVWLFYSVMLLAPGVAGWKLKGRQRRLAVERKLDMVGASLHRVEELLGTGRHLAAVRELRRPGVRP